jgi:hypothetical protein
MSLEQFLSIVSGLGAASGPIFAVLFWMERAERKETNEVLLKVIPDAIAAIRDTKAAVDMLRVAMGGRDPP